MMPYMTPQEKAIHDQQIKAALVVAALAMRDWKQTDPVDRLWDLLRQHAQGDEELVTKAACIIAACNSG